MHDSERNNGYGNLLLTNTSRQTKFAATRCTAGSKDTTNWGTSNMSIGESLDASQEQ
jgi:hypothetical protein